MNNLNMEMQAVDTKTTMEWLKILAPKIAAVAMTVRPCSSWALEDALATGGYQHLETTGTDLDTASKDGWFMFVQFASWQFPKSPFLGQLIAAICPRLIIQAICS